MLRGADMRFGIATLSLLLLAACSSTSHPATTDAGTGGVGGGSRGGGLGGIGEAIGTVIGVVIIRGGAGGVDHCDPRTDRHPRNGPVAYPDIWARAGGGMAPNNPVPHRRGLPR